MASNKFDRISNSDVGKGAALSEKNSVSETTTKRKVLNRLPVSLEERFNKLKDTGKYHGSFSAFINDSIYEKLEREEQK